MDLYNTLGVTRDASTRDVRAAYRKKSKTHHPDKGGSAEEFDKIRRAHVILTNPERRKSYDENGDTEDKPDNTLSNALGLITQVMNETITRLLQHRIDPLRRNLVADMSDLIRERQTNDKNQKKQMQEGIDRIRNMAKLFKVKDGENHIATLLKTQENEIQKHLRTTVQRIEVATFALDLLKNYTFEQLVANGSGFPDIH